MRCEKMKIHPPFEFVLENNQECYSGDDVYEVFEKLTQTLKDCTCYKLTNAQKLLRFYSIAENEIEQLDSTNYINEVFAILQNHLVGTWKWYNGILNREHWRHSMYTNSVSRKLRRMPHSQKRRKLNFTPEWKEKVLKNLEKGRELWSARAAVKREAREKAKAEKEEAKRIYLAEHAEELAEARKAKRKHYYQTHKEKFREYYEKRYKAKCEAQKAEAQRILNGDIEREN